MSRQNYYAQRRRRQREKVDGDLVERLAKRERCVQPRLGGRKLHRLLQKELAEAGVELGRDRFFKVLAEHKLLLEPKAAAFPCTTHSRHNRFSVFGTDYR
jgi:putative transposase